MNINTINNINYINIDNLNNNHTLVEFLQSNDLTAEILIDYLENNSDELKKLYQLKAGVTEGYTIREHTLRVLEEFEKEFDNEAVNQLLKEVGLSRNEFALFLAMHDIGKGLAVLEEGAPSPKRKEKELKYGIEQINKLDISDEKKSIFAALLIDDNIGELLKKPYTSSAYLVQTANELNNAAESCSLDLKSFTKLKILFHKIDSSSYPTLRYKVFESDFMQSFVIGDSKFHGIKDYNSNSLARVASLYKTIDTMLLPEDSIKSFENVCEHTNFYHRPLDSFSSEEILGLELFRADNTDKKNSYTYHKFSNRLKLIKSRNLIFRIIQAYRISQKPKCGMHQDTKKLGNITTVLNNEYPFLKYANFPWSQGKKILSKNLVTDCKEVSNSLQILQNLGPIHGTMSAVLGLCKASGCWNLYALGQMYDEGFSPMCGEISCGGFSFYGVNRSKISAETIRNFDRAEQYAKNSAHTFDFDKLASLFTYISNDNQTKEKWMNSMVERDQLGVTGTRIMQIRQWNEHFFQENIATLGIDKAAKSCHEEYLNILDKIEAVLSEENCNNNNSIHNLSDMKYMIKKMSILGGEMQVLGGHTIHTLDHVIKLIRAYKSSASEADISNLKEFITNTKERYNSWYQKFYDVIDPNKASVSIEPEHRDLIANPFPIILSSTTLKPFGANIAATEYTLSGPVPFGKDGIDVMFTDTEEHKTKILELLPEHLRKEIDVYLFDEVRQTKLPHLIHGLHQVNT